MDEKSPVPLVIITGLDLWNHKFGAAAQLQLVVDESAWSPISKEKSLRNKHPKQFWVLNSRDTIQAGDQLFHYSYPMAMTRSIGSCF
jgi:hypothetical protein